MPKNVKTRFHLGHQESQVDLGLIEEVRIEKATLENVDKALIKLLRHYERSAANALLHATKPIFKKSQKYVPIEYGPLKASGYHEIVRDAAKPTVRVGYSKDDMPWTRYPSSPFGYALVVHERYDLKHEAPTRAGYLRSAFREHVQDIAPRAKKYLRKRVMNAVGAGA